MAGSADESRCPRCGRTLSTTVEGPEAGDQLAADRVSCPSCGAGLVRAVDGHADRGWQLADGDA